MVGERRRYVRIQNFRGERGSHILHVTRNQDPIDTGMAYVGIYGNIKTFNTDEVSLFLVSLGVTNYSNGGGIGLSPMVQALRFVYAFPMGVHFTPLYILIFRERIIGIDTRNNFII